MTSKSPDYPSYTVDELKEALLSVDKEQYPDRVMVIESELAARKRGGRKQQLPKYVQLEPNRGTKSIVGRVVVLATFGPFLTLSIWFGKIPARAEGMIEYNDKPGVFVLVWFIYLAVGIYFYNLRDHDDRA